MSRVQLIFPMQIKNSALLLESLNEFAYPKHPSLKKVIAWLPTRKSFVYLLWMYFVCKFPHFSKESLTAL